MNHATPAAAAGGGVLIGVAVTWLWLALGRIAGISGIVGGLSRTDAGWRLAFLAGLLLTPIALAERGVAVAWQPPETSWPVLIIGGLLVGFGTRLGSGCTSGHAVCGIARLSPRSMLATLLFMLTAAAVVFATRHGFGR